VMLPFWGGFAKTYAKVQSALAKKCPQTASIAVSYRGTGAATNKALDVDHRQYAISTVAAELAKFLRSDAVTSLVDTTRLVLCGHSWSAKVSLAFLMREASAANVAVCYDLCCYATLRVRPRVGSLERSVKGSQASSHNLLSLSNRWDHNMSCTRSIVRILRWLYT
jgi:pimeloyl-ACP methyl ester carboxylesterase